MATGLKESWNHLKRVRDEAPGSQKESLYSRAIYLTMGGNLFLAGAKSILAWLTGSSAIFADAVNSVTDTLYSILMALGLYVSRRPADESHPQGHSQFEPFVSIFIAAAMAAAGIAAIWQSIQRLVGRGEAINLGWPTFVLLGAALVKVVMFLAMKKIGQEAHSPAIKASARDNLADILTTSAALLGVWGSRYIHPYFDPVAGLFVAFWIFRATVEILRENFGYLTGRGAEEEVSHQVAETAIGVSGVLDVHRVIAEYVGPDLRIDMHIDVDSSVSLARSHEIAEEVREKVRSLPRVDLVYVHVEPAGSREDNR